jgi:hypothetical protein
MNILNDKSDLNFVRQKEIEQVQQEKQEFKLLGTYLRTVGLNLYCYNPHKNIVEEVEVKSNSKTCVLVPLEVGYLIEDYEKPKIEVNPTWDYFEALNLKNAIKRVEKFKQGKIKSIWNLRIPNRNAMSLSFF